MQKSIVTESNKICSKKLGTQSCCEFDEKVWNKILKRLCPTASIALPKHKSKPSYGLKLRKNVHKAQMLLTAYENIGLFFFKQILCLENVS